MPLINTRIPLQGPSCFGRSLSLWRSDDSAIDRWHFVTSNPMAVASWQNAANNREQGLIGSARSTMLGYTQITLPKNVVWHKELVHLDHLTRFTKDITMQRKFLVPLIFLPIGIGLLVWYFWPSRNGAASAKELNLLCWVGYEERSMLEPFEKKYNVKVKYKTFVGGDEMFALATQSKGQYDVVVVDPEYIEKLHTVGKLAALDVSDYNFTDYHETFRAFPACWKNGRLYALLVRFGVNGLLYNSEHLSEEDVKSYSILWDPKVKGKVGIWDWYLPSMGVVSRALGNENPYEISEQEFLNLKEHLDSLRPQVAAFHSKPPEVLTALANGQTWIVPGGGESWAGILRQQGKPIDWCIPKEGALMWAETLVILNDAPHSETAKLYLQWMNSAEAQALLTEREAYNSNVPNAKAYNLLTAQQKDNLKVHDEAEAKALVSRLSVRQLPVNQSEKGWQEVWQRFKAQ